RRRHTRCLSDWSSDVCSSDLSVKMLGYERQAHQKETSDGKIKTSTRRLFEYKQAVRSNRQLAVVLRDQGLNEEADHFAYRAQLRSEERRVGKEWCTGMRRVRW